ncbi:MAG: SUMF1/EgtB/PvdO family nonheme iron enzyme [Spirochaetaceae bacterium]|jgi:formylglycine-generating enzyme required for sulfatase activity/TolB-like protein|nr:SUMF1/EgtB/PvdO family nonheme iron enzyme [Spirochaetaceae bacterium]
MKKYLLLLTALWTINSALFPQIMSLDEAIRAAAQSVERGLAAGIKVAVLNFTSSSERLSDYVVEELATTLVNGRRLVVVDRRDIDLIRREMHFQFSGDVSDESAQRIGVMLGAQSIISGSLVDTGVNYRFRINVINVESAVLEASASITVSGRDRQTYFLLTGQRAMPDNSLPVPQSGGEFGEELPGGLVRITGGSFIMGSPALEPQRKNDEVPHQVIVSGFYMGKHEVTQKDYLAIMGTMPDTRFQGEDLPVENVSWYEAVEYCNRRSELEGLTPVYIIDRTRSDPNNKSADDLVRWVVTWDPEANGYRLPTEAEWEYACRAGTAGPFYTGANILSSHANYDGNYPYNNNPRGTYADATLPVGSFPPNLWGLYDMHGNVREWCWDWYGNYGGPGQSDPAGPLSGSARVERGGSWYSDGQVLRSANRNGVSPSYRIGDLGFRLARTSF